MVYIKDTDKKKHLEIVAHREKTNCIRAISGKHSAANSKIV